jgi:hypothetical protein
MRSSPIPLHLEMEPFCIAANIVEVPWDDVELGDVLGEGSFSSVHSATTSHRGRNCLEQQTRE